MGLSLGHRLLTCYAVFHYCIVSLSSFIVLLLLLPFSNRALMERCTLSVRAQGHCPYYSPQKEHPQPGKFLPAHGRGAEPSLTPLTRSGPPLPLRFSPMVRGGSRTRPLSGGPDHDTPKLAHS